MSEFSRSGSGSGIEHVKTNSRHILRHVFQSNNFARFLAGYLNSEYLPDLHEKFEQVRNRRHKKLELEIPEDVFSALIPLEDGNRVKKKDCHTVDQTQYDLFWHLNEQDPELLKSFLVLQTALEKFISSNLNQTGASEADQNRIREQLGINSIIEEFLPHFVLLKDKRAGDVSGDFFRKAYQNAMARGAMASAEIEEEPADADSEYDDPKEVFYVTSCPFKYFIRDVLKIRLGVDGKGDVFAPETPAGNIGDVILGIQAKLDHDEAQGLDQNPQKTVSGRSNILPGWSP